MKKILIGNPLGATKPEKELRKLLRLLINYYLYQFHIPHTYHSSKIKKGSRIFHLLALAKKLFQQIV